MKIFLTGGTGFIGSHFINEAIENNHDLVCLKRLKSKPAIKLIDEPTWVDGNLGHDLKQYMQGCDILVHLAAVGVSPKHANWEKLLKYNVTAVLELARQAIDIGITKWLIAGSYLEYGRSADRFDFIPSDAPLEPISPYAASKAAAFELLHSLVCENNIKMIYARIFSAFGDGQYLSNFWPSLQEAALKGRDFPMTNGEQIRDFIPVENVAKRLVQLLDFNKLKSGNPLIINIGTGCPKTLKDFAKYWWKEWGAKGKLNVGALPYRQHEIMRFVPEI